MIGLLPPSSLALLSLSRSHPLLHRRSSMVVCRSSSSQYTPCNRTLHWTYIYTSCTGGMATPFQASVLFFIVFNVPRGVPRPHPLQTIYTWARIRQYDYSPRLSIWKVSEVLLYTDLDPRIPVNQIVVIPCYRVIPRVPNLLLHKPRPPCHIPTRPTSSAHSEEPPHCPVCEDPSCERHTGAAGREYLHVSGSAFLVQSRVHKYYNYLLLNRSSFLR